MAPSLVDVMEGVAARLETVPDLRVTFYTPDQINPPQAVVGMPEVTDYHSSMGRGLVELSLGVQVFVSSVDDRTGQIALGAYGDPAGPSSVVRAVEGDRTLGGVVSDCIVTSFRPFGRQDVNGVAMYVGEFSLRIYASGK